MTKTLTEQWRDGELFGFYYVKEPKKEPKIHNVSCMDYLLDECGVEVLSPVPDYYDCKGLIYDSINMDKARKRIDGLVSKTEQLEKQLEIATNALKGCYNDMKYWAVLTHRNQRILSVIKQALKEMEGVK